MSHLTFEESETFRAMSRRYRTMVALNSVLLLSLVGACVSSAVASDGLPLRNEIRANAFVLVNADGQEVGRFGCHRNGVGIAMWNESADTVVQLGVGLEPTWSQGFDLLDVSNELISGSAPEDSDHFADGTKRPVGSLVMVSNNSDGTHATTNFVTASGEHRWIASQVDSRGREGTALMLNGSNGLAFTLEGAGEEGSGIASLFAGPEGAAVSVSDDDFDAGLYQYNGAAGLKLSRLETEGSQLDMQLTSDGASLTIEDARGAEVARLPE